MSDHGTKQLVVRLFGPLVIRHADGSPPPLSGGRQKALIALLASAPGMSRSRAWLIDTLWSDSAPDRGRANLRQLLHSLRGALGGDFDDLFVLSSDDVALRPGRVRLVGSPADGAFLEGVDLAQEGFEDWLRDRRQAEGAGLASVLAPVADLPLLPRIAVGQDPTLPGAGRQGLGDALAYEITSGFARSQLIDAISHFSSRAVAPGAAWDRGLQADYALTGQCRLIDDALIVDATLHDIVADRVIWSDRHRTGLRAFLAGEDALVGHVVGQSLRLIMSGSVAASAGRPLPELEAHELMIAAVSLMHAFEKRHFERAHAQLEEVVHRCPAQPVARAWLAQWHLLRVYQKWSADPDSDHRRARALIASALDLNPSCPLSLAIDGNIHTVLDGDFRTAAQRFDAAQAINPSSAMINQLASVLETFRGDGARAVALTERAEHLSPRDPRRPFFQTLSAGSYVAGGRYDRAVEMAEASLWHNPQHLSAHRCRVIALQLAGRAAEARAAARQLLEIDPAMNVSDYLRHHPAGQTPLSQTWGDALKDAGIPLN